MKTRSELSRIMKDAWIIFRDSLDDFSEALKKAWAISRLRKAMHEGVARFQFIKKDGTVRNALGTLANAGDLTKGTGHYNKSEKVQVYFDLDRNAFRCFTKTSLVIE